MGEPYRVAVVGVGIGRLHLEAYHSLPQHFTIAAVCDRDVDRARSVAEAFGVDRLITDFDALCKQDDIDVIDICTPSSLHTPQSLQALAAGKHVVCEKPIGGSLKDIDALIAAEAASGRRLMPIFQYRFGHGAQKLKRLIERGVTGPSYAVTIETHWRRGPDYYAVPWRGRKATELGGVALTHAIHAHDLLVYLTGPLRSVSARIATRVNAIETEDCVAAAVELGDGGLGTLSVTVGSMHEISRHRFCFSNLTAESQTSPYTNTADPWTITAANPDVDAIVAAVLADYEPEPEGFAGQFLRFARALDTGGPLPVTLAEARATIELTTAIYSSARTGCAQDLPLTADHPAYAGWNA